MEKLLKELREKAKKCGTKTKEDRARKGAYVDCIIAIEKQLALCNVVGRSEQFVCSCGSINVKTTGSSQCPNNRCSSAN